MPARAVVFLALAAALVAGAFAAGAALAARDRAGARAADKTRGMALLGANVEYFSGGLLAGSGAVSSTKIDTGRYRVTFARDIADCYVVATVYDAGVGRGFAATWLKSENSVDVVTCNATVSCSSSPADHSFELVAFCPK